MTCATPIPEETLSGETRLFPVLGDPIAFVKSPQRLTAGFSARGHNAACVPMLVPEAQLPDVMQGLSLISNIGGLLITMPHKFAAFDFCATSSERARLLGVVSVMRRNADGSWHGDMLDGLAFVKAHPQGAVFNYSTGESCLLAAVVAAATGRPLADYFSQTIWRPAGMEADAHWQLESEGGLELGGLGVSARLRDIGRFGQLVLDDGEAFNGRRVLPPGWRDRAGQPDSPATAFGRLAPGATGGYGYHWWSVAPLPGGVNNGAFTALGAHGQFIFVNPTEQVVVAIQSAWRQLHDSDAMTETVALLRAVMRALRP